MLETLPAPTATVPPSAKRPLTGMTLRELEVILESRTRALATLNWLYGTEKLPALLPESHPEVTGRSWSRLREICELPTHKILERHLSADGTTKYAIELSGAAIETVLIPTEDRSTVCVSSQAGCTRACGFCATARLGFGRNLTASEIVTQYLIARQDAVPSAPARNIVFMGMGEPMDNLDEVLTALEIFTQAPAPRLSQAHLTVSTSGVLPGILRFLKESKANLALSLNGTTDAQREVLMPQNKIWPIAELLGALRSDAKNTGRSFFIEYVVFDGVNDGDDDARRMVTLLEEIPVRVNLIPHNPFPGSPFLPAKDERLKAMQKIVAAAGLRCIVRWPRGREIGAACGQLAMTVSEGVVVPEQKLKRRATK